MACRCGTSSAHEWGPSSGVGHLNNERSHLSSRFVRVLCQEKRWAAGFLSYEWRRRLCFDFRFLDEVGFGVLHGLLRVGAMVCLTSKGSTKGGLEHDRRGPFGNHCHACRVSRLYPIGAAHPARCPDSACGRQVASGIRLRLSVQHGVIRIWGCLFLWVSKEGADLSRMKGFSWRDT